MTTARRTVSSLPDRQDVLDFVLDNPDHVSRRELARAFKIARNDRGAFNAMLRELEREGLLARGRGKGYAARGALPPVGVVEIVGPDADGEVVARPVVWHGEGVPPVVYMAPDRRIRPAPGPGDRVLARLALIAPGEYEGRAIRRVGGHAGRVLGVFEPGPEGARVRPVDRRQKYDLTIAGTDTGDAQPGELVIAEMLPARRLGLRQARVVERLGGGHDIHTISLIAIHSNDIPTEFDPAALAEAETAGAAGTADRVDLRSLPLVTIDGADARDFDDAVWAEGDGEGWHLIVAIADVAHYVRPGGALDAAARERGNSVYFPDRVVPMLPEVLSNGWCSLKPDEDRPCLAVHIWIDKAGGIRRHRFERATMRSAARLTYSQVQAARDGTPDRDTAPLMDRAIAPLYGAFASLLLARRERAALELDRSEPKVILDPAGGIASVEMQTRHDSHRIVEEFMIAANVCAAVSLEQRRQACIYRVHDAPDPAKVEALRDFLQGLGLRLARGQAITARTFNRVLERAANTPYAEVVGLVVLRSQAQAAYSTENIGHFGLALRRYCHFTSPIRRYADLTVHRALIRALDQGDGGATDAEVAGLEGAAEHISMTERRAVAAERGAMDRYMAAFMADRRGAVFDARISGVTRFGLFVTLLEIGAEGLVPVRTLPQDRYDHDALGHRLAGRRSGLEFALGDQIQVKLIEAEPVTGSLVFDAMVRAESGRARGRKGGGRGLGGGPRRGGRRRGGTRKT